MDDNYLNVKKLILLLQSYANQLEFNQIIKENYYIWENDRQKYIVITRLETCNSNELDCFIKEENASGAVIIDRSIENYKSYSFKDLDKLIKQKTAIASQYCFDIILLSLFGNITFNEQINNLKALINYNPQHEEINEKSILASVVPHYLGNNFKKRKNLFISQDERICIYKMKSKSYDANLWKYWYTLYLDNKQVIDKYDTSYVLLLFKDNPNCLVIPTSYLYQYLDKIGNTNNGGNTGWHIKICEFDNDYSIYVSGSTNIPVTQFIYKSK